jgi:hypothetical protein
MRWPCMELMQNWAYLVNQLHLTIPILVDSGVTYYALLQLRLELSCAAQVCVGYVEMF